MSSLFDLPFEDEPEASARHDATAEPSVHERRRTIYTVSELTAGIRHLLETAYVDVWVEGEISNCRLWNTGHLYFTLKDPGSQVKAVMFKSDVRSLKFKPEDGLHVVARGRLSVYDPKGEYQIVCERLETHGLGALPVRCGPLETRLQAEGLFGAARKRPLPALPRKIGIVTSLDGAAIRDIIKVLRRRYANAHLVIAPARVQGEGAAEDITRALRQIGRVAGVDVVIVGRGGGSIEDLWAFNEEMVARAIARSPVPVISAVGHETDVTIADFVADLRAPTPAASAELVVSRKDEFCGWIDRLHDRLHAAARGRARGLAGIRTRLVGVEGGLAKAMTGRRHAVRSHVGTYVSRLEAMSPLAVLGRGYAVCWNADRTQVIHDASQTATGERVRVTLARGELDCEVRSNADRTQRTQRTPTEEP